MEELLKQYDKVMADLNSQLALAKENIDKLEDGDKKEFLKKSLVEAAKGEMDITSFIKVINSWEKY